MQKIILTAEIETSLKKLLNEIEKIEKEIKELQLQLGKPQEIINKIFAREFGFDENDVRFMNGSESTEVRQKALKDFRAGEFSVLIGTSIYDEGIDIPAIGAGVNFAAGDSEIKTIQRLGRVIRRSKLPGDIDVDTSVSEDVYYMDFFDKSHKFVRKHSANRLEVYKGEEAFTVKLVSGVEFVHVAKE